MYHTYQLVVEKVKQLAIFLGTLPRDRSRIELNENNAIVCTILKLVTVASPADSELGTLFPSVQEVGILQPSLAELSHLQPLNLVHLATTYVLALSTTPSRGSNCVHWKYVTSGFLAKKHRYANSLGRIVWRYPGKVMCVQVLLKYLVDHYIISQLMA